jgi:hypothetical protein
MLLYRACYLNDVKSVDSPILVEAPSGQQHGLKARRGRSRTMSSQVWFTENDEGAKFN